MSKILVVTPTYNRAHTIGDTIQSVQAQDYTDFIHIIVDDGSDDRTEEVVRKFMATDPRIRYAKRVRRPTDIRTSSNALNYGIDLGLDPNLGFLSPEEIAEITHLTTIHSDDLKLKYSLLTQYAATRDPEVGACFTDAIRWNPEKGWITLWRGYPTHDLDRLINRIYVQNIPNFTMFWRVDFLKEMVDNRVGENLSRYGIYDPLVRYAEDRDVSMLTTLTAKRTGRRLVYLSNVFSACYREHSDSICGNTCIEERKQNLRRVEEKYFPMPKRVELYLRRLVDRPTYRLPYKFRKRYLRELEEWLYPEERFPITPEWERRIFWFRVSGS